MENLKIYEAVRKVPQEALKPIQAGRLKGKSDINPMWRIKKLTEVFGPCGVGWKYIITKQWMEPGSAGEIATFCDVDLYVKADGQWCDPIPGTGGSMFVAKEKNGLYTNDECYKMALTDALSVACKALGVAADVYWDRDPSKYDSPPPKYPGHPLECGVCHGPIKGMVIKGRKFTAQEVAETYGKCAKCLQAEAAHGNPV